MVELEDALQKIDGVGPATTQKIVDVVDEHYSNEEIEGLLRDAVEYDEAGDPDYALKFVRRALEEL